MNADDKARELDRVINALASQSEALRAGGNFAGDVDDRLVAAIHASATLMLAREGVMMWPQS